MCETTVYLLREGREEEIMRDVMLLQPEGDAFLLVNLLGEQKLVRGSIKKIDFLKHTLVFEEAETPASR
ncbi:MAG: RNA-binding protein [Thermoplasmata archaeon]|nr:MAG: RNA-binding protein [Thermoplasmata archaeon]HDH09383.1 CooT family nickel-binding protein [Chloroflexota bacterium]